MAATAAVPAQFRMRAVEADISGLRVDAIVNAANSELLARCYRSYLDLASGHGLRSAAFPAVSTGIYGFPRELAAAIAVGAVAKVLAGKPDLMVIVCCFGDGSAALHQAAPAASAGAQEAGRPAD
jgi:O-acetyl-ADP-ribose deacetylase (regulator of RNase III)